MENDSAEARCRCHRLLAPHGPACARCLHRHHRKEDTAKRPSARSATPERFRSPNSEFDEAQRLARPILLFIMGEKRLVLESQIETKVGEQEEAERLPSSARSRWGRIRKLHRVYATFNSLEEFKEKAAQSVAELRRYLDEQDDAESKADDIPDEEKKAEKRDPDPIPKPPAFYAEPAYLGSHEFVGRRDQLETLNEWALPADSHPVLLFEAIGGNGKSMLTWEWAKTNRDATPPPSATGPGASGIRSTRRAPSWRLLPARARLHDGPAAGELRERSPPRS